MTDRVDNSSASTEGVLDLFRRWFESRRVQWEALGYSVELTFGSPDHRPTSAWIDFASLDRLGQLQLWSDGQSSVSVLRISTGEPVLNEYRERVIDEPGLDEIVAVILDQPSS